MTFEEIDRALASWNQRLAAIAENLLELQADPTYQVLTGSGGTARLELTGATARRVLPALKPIEGVFHQFSLLQPVIDRAAQLRKDLPVFGRDQALREIEALLLGESIQLPADALALKERTLLSGAQGRLRPEQLLAIMANAYTQARDAVTAVSCAWDELAQEVDAAETEMRRLEAQAAAANCDLPQALAQARQTLRELKDRMQSDPLSARDEWKARLRPALDEAARYLNARLLLRQQFQAAQESLARLRRLEADLHAAASSSRAKILACDSPPEPAPAQSESLAAWLGRLEQRNGCERPETIAHGMDNWQRAAANAIEAGTQRLQLERLPLETRGELRGRLDALKAKARVYGLAEDSAMAGLAGQAEELLYTQPTDLARSATAVQEYERRLRTSAPARPESRERR